jgi:hypothetical protein
MDIYELLKLLGKNAVQQYAGAGEAGLSAATGIVSGAAAPIGGAIATYQNNGANPYEQEIMNFMQRNTYAPRTEVGQQRAEQIGEFANRNLVPIAPMLEGLALPLTAGGRARYNPTASRATMEKIVPDSVTGKSMGQTASVNEVVSPQPYSLLEDFTDFGKPVPAGKQDTVTLRHKTSGKEIVVTKEGAKAPFYTKEFDVVSPNESLLGDFVDFGKPIPAEKNNTVNLRHKTSGKEIVVTKEAAKSPFYTKEYNVYDPFYEDVVNNFDSYAKQYESFNDRKSHYFTDGGRIISSDSGRETFPIYTEDRTRSALVHEGASELAKRMYAKKLSEPVPKGYDSKVLFTAGGTGAGKTSAIDSNPLLKPIADKANIIYDTNMNGLQSSVKKIEQALDAGREVDIVYTYRDPEEALRLGALTRAMNMKKNTGSGRTVPLNEHLKTHMGSYDTMLKLQQKYKDDPRVQIQALDNSYGKGNSKLVTLDKIPKINENEVSPRLNRALEEEYQSGRISKDIYEATKVQ